MAVVTTCQMCGKSWKPNEPSRCTCDRLEPWLALLIPIALLALAAAFAR